MPTNQPPQRQIRARYDDSTVRVYQAYSAEIALPALAAGRFVPPFKVERMTWIKPSFLWMMYRSGWATKSGQEHVLAIDITRKGFEWALAHASLSHFDASIHASREVWHIQKESAPVRIQWDPERDLNLQRLDYRSIQIGLGPAAVPLYVNEWITAITDITTEVHAIANGDHAQLASILNQEQPYQVPDNIRGQIGISI